MSLLLTKVLLTLTPLLPLALAVAMVHRGARDGVARLLPYAPLPALAAAMLAEPGVDVWLQPLLLGLDLGLDGARRLLLAMTALVWVAAGFYGREYIARDSRQHRYNAFFLATMGGNLGLIVALDAAGFYLFFSLMTLCAYMLVVFENDDRAYRAGRIYLVLSLLGEMALLFGLLRAVDAAGSLMIAEMPEALVEGEGTTLLLLFVGFAIKAGQLPLHVWLPLAHPAAPTPASAVLSGAMIKAGLLGMVLFLPFGQASLPDIGLLIAGLGLATAFYAVICGLPQRNPKTVLAYSSVSQMGVMVAALGPLLAVPGTEALLLPAILLYAVHHGLAKAGLFLAVGVRQRAALRRGRVLLVAGIAAVAIAGAPLTAGSLTKHLIKTGVEGGQGGSVDMVANLLSWTAVGTFLLMLRFLLLLKRERPSDDRAASCFWLWGPFLLLVLAGQLLPWFLALREGIGAEVISLYGIWESLWPILFALGLWALWSLAKRQGFRWKCDVPEGDLINLAPTHEEAASRADAAYGRTARLLRRRPEVLFRLNEMIGSRIERWEAGLLRPSAAAVAVLLAVAATAASLV